MAMLQEAPQKAPGVGDGNQAFLPEPGQVGPILEDGRGCPEF